MGRAAGRWNREAHRLRGETCRHFHGEAARDSKMVCPECVATALRWAYEAGQVEGKGAGETRGAADLAGAAAYVIADLAEALQAVMSVPAAAAEVARAGLVGQVEAALSRGREGAAA